MRVIEPKHRQSQYKKYRKRKKGLRFGVSLALLAIVITGFFVSNALKTSTQKQQKQSSKNQSLNTAEAKPKKGVLKSFTGPEFRDLYNSFAHPNTAYISESTPITDSEAADDRVRKLANDRGYRIQSAPVTDAFRDVGDGHLLQERAAGYWQQLKEASAKSGLEMGLSAAYRSADDQRQIFLTRLSQAGVSVANIANGSSDAQITQVLKTTAVPGYSRHHSGYTVDITCKNDPTLRFEASKCFKWLSADNYKNAKTYGWIPSYPEGAGLQGPDPEAWEYIWVGVDALTD